MVVENQVVNGMLGMGMSVVKVVCKAARHKDWSGGYDGCGVRA